LKLPSPQSSSVQFADMEKRIDEEQLAECKEAFFLLDKDGDGTISAEELGEVMRSLGKNLTQAELQCMIDDVGADGTGTVSFPVFLSLMSGNMGVTDAELIAVFKSFDLDGDGFITATELDGGFRTLGEELTYEEVHEMIHEADRDGDGQINFEEFLTMMRPK